MSTILRRLVAPVLALALLTLPVFAEDLAKAKPEEVGVSSTRLQRLTDAMQAYVQQGRLAGAVTLVARRGKVIYLEAVGQRDREARSPMKTDSMFRRLRMFSSGLAFTIRRSATAPAASEPISPAL